MTARRPNLEWSDGAAGPALKAGHTLTALELAVLSAREDHPGDGWEQTAARLGVTVAMAAQAAGRARKRLTEAAAHTRRNTYPAPLLALLSKIAAPAGTWRDRALCAEADPEAFFPDQGGSTKEGKAVCRACHVRADCLDDALANGERFGSWGGLSERERRRYTRNSQEAAA